MTLPKAFITDPYITEKAEHMVRRHGDAFVSDYLGMAEAQVRRIRKTPRYTGERSNHVHSTLAKRKPYDTKYDDIAQAKIIHASAQLAKAVSSCLARNGWRI